jgi:hypothetical protein
MAVSNTFFTPPASINPNYVGIYKNEQYAYNIPRIIDKISPKNMMIVCATSVHITAFIPPYIIPSISLVFHRRVLTTLVYNVQIIPHDPTANHICSPVT